MASIALGIGSIVSAGIGAIGATSAASTQANAANNAAQLQFKLGQEALDFQKQINTQNQGNLAPWLQTGKAGLGELGYLLGIPGAYNGSNMTPAPAGAFPGVTPASDVPTARTLGNPRLAGTEFIHPGGATTTSANNLRYAPASLQNNATSTGAPGFGIPAGTGNFGSLMQPFSEQFKAPTLEQAQNYPGYQFQLGQGLNAMANSAAARGGLVSGNATTAFNNFAQGAAQSDYTNIYNQAMQEYMNRYNIFNSNQTNQFNRLAAISGLGQTTATQLGSLGQASAGNVGNLLLGTGAQVGQNINNAGAATASGYVGATNAATGGINNLLGIYLAQQQGLFNKPNPGLSAADATQNALGF
jgi:hypothetical protein